MKPDEITSKAESTMYFKNLMPWFSTIQMETPSEQMAYWIIVIYIIIYLVQTISRLLWTENEIFSLNY